MYYMMLLLTMHKPLTNQLFKRFSKCKELGAILFFSFLFFSFFFITPETVVILIESNILQEYLYLKHIHICMWHHLKQILSSIKAMDCPFNTSKIALDPWTDQEGPCDQQWQSQYNLLKFTIMYVSVCI